MTEEKTEDPPELTVEDKLRALNAKLVEERNRAYNDLNATQTKLQAHKRKVELIAGDFTRERMVSTGLRKRVDSMKGLLRAIYENGGQLPEERQSELKDLAEELGWA